MSTLGKDLGWNDRFKLIDHYSPSAEQICKAFGVSATELQTAQELRDTPNGPFSAGSDIKVTDYAKLFGDTPLVDTGTKSSTSHGSKQTTITTVIPQTATKTVKALKKRGRKGTNIAAAFKAIPSTPTPVEAFAETHKVSIAVLRQSKRFDTTPVEEGSVKVKKDKVTKVLMIHREPLKT